MTKDIPLVCKAILTDPAHHGPAIPLDTPAWFAWLEASSTTRFSYAFYNHTAGYIDGFMTLRKERRQRGGVYWFIIGAKLVRLTQAARASRKFLDLFWSGGDGNTWTQERLEGLYGQVRNYEDVIPNQRLNTEDNPPANNLIDVGEDRGIDTLTNDREKVVYPDPLNREADALLPMDQG